MKKNKISKKNQKIIKTLLIIVACYIFIVIFNIPIPFRYSVVPVNPVISHKIDRLTGKTEIINPTDNRYKEKKVKPPTPTPTPRPFPVEYLEISNSDIETAGIRPDGSPAYWKIFGTITNKSTALYVTNINTKLKFAKENGDPISESRNKIVQIYTRDVFSTPIKLEPKSTKQFMIISSVDELFNYNKFKYGVFIQSAEIYTP